MPDEDGGPLDQAGQHAARLFDHAQLEVTETAALEDS
jgi:hypothetical protein